MARRLRRQAGGSLLREAALELQNLVLEMEPDVEDPMRFKRLTKYTDFYSHRSDLERLSNSRAHLDSPAAASYLR